MPHDTALIVTLTGGLVAALAFGFLTQKIGLSPIVGYLIAGILLGPHTPGFVADEEIAHQFAELGVVLLMFGVGLHFHLKDLLSVWKVAVPGAISQITAATSMAVLCTWGFFGWTITQGVIFGLALSVASTVVLTRVLAENRALHTNTGHTAVGWLVVEDIFTILVLVLLPALAGGGQSGTSIGATLGIATLKLGVLVIFTLVVGQKIIPWFLGYIARTRSRELFTLSVLALALGIAVGSAKFFGASMPLGAFLAGMVVGQSEFSARAASDALPMRDAFAVLFFVSVGMLFDPTALITAWPLTLITLALVLVIKPLVAVAVVLFFKKPLRTSLHLAAALAQIGEFSFILAQLAESMKLSPTGALNALVFTSIISIALNPLIYKSVEPLATWIEQKFPSLQRRHSLGFSPTALVPDAESTRVVIVGYGPVGRTLNRILRDNHIETVVIEMNLDTVAGLRAEKIPVVYGEASSREILHHAGVEKAVGLIIAASSAFTREVVSAARDLNPKIRIVARANYLVETSDIAQAGADAVFSGEGEIALSMTTFLMESLGASGEQVEKERDRVREELFPA